MHDALGEPGMSPLRLEEEVTTALHSGLTYRQVCSATGQAVACKQDAAAADIAVHLQGHPKPDEPADAHMR